MNKKVTMHDIAYQLNISQSTVSKALGGHSMISNFTKQRVAEVARQLNYKIDKSARAVRTGRTDTLAVVIFSQSPVDEASIPPFFESLIFSISKACSSLGYDLLVVFQQDSDDWYGDLISSSKADGLIILGYDNFLQHSKKIEQLNRMRTPYVCWGINEQQYCSVSYDNCCGGLAVGEYLLGENRLNWLYVGSVTAELPEFRDRYLGLHTAANQSKSCDSLQQINALSTVESGELSVTQAIASGLPFDALICASDVIALGAIQALKKAGKLVPQEIVVIGFDDIPAAAQSVPALTTVRQSPAEAGLQLVKVLQQRISSGILTREMLKPELIVREST